jgi:hypothetical protein
LPETADGIKRCTILRNSVGVQMLLMLLSLSELLGHLL